MSWYMWLMAHEDIARKNSISVAEAFSHDKTDPCSMNKLQIFLLNSNEYSISPWIVRLVSVWTQRLDSSIE